MTRKLNFKKLLLFLGDALLLYCSLFLTLIIRYREWPAPENIQLNLNPFLVIFTIWLVVFYVGKLYDAEKSISWLKLTNNLVKLQAINAIISVIFFYSIPLFKIAPKTNLLINLAVSLALLFVWRLIVNQIFSNRFLLEKTGIVGFNSETKEIITALKNNPHIGYQVIAVFTDEKGAYNDQIPVYGLDMIEKITAQEKIQVIIGFLENETSGAQATEALYRGIFKGLKFYDTADFYETITGKIPLSLIKRNWFLENISSQIKRPYDLLKRTLDIVFSLILGLATLIILPIVFIGNKLTDKGPVFFRQKRIGQNGKTFTLIKFRTMKQDAEKSGPKFAQENDERITKFGKMLRLTRLDELPQAWNILKGDLSLVGPRPEQPEFVAEFEQKIPFYQIRHLVKPGLSGWAQINYEYAASVEETKIKLQYELYYIKNRSLILDLGIALKTINIMLSRAGK